MLKDGIWTSIEFEMRNTFRSEFGRNNERREEDGVKRRGRREERIESERNG